MSTPAPSSGGARICDAADVARALSVVREQSAGRATTASMARPVDTAGALDALKLDPMLPVHDGLRELLPWPGLRRGSVVSVLGSASLLLAMLGAASAQGSWCAVVGMPELGMVAAAEAGVVLDRLALVPHPGPLWAEAASALIDGFDVVVARPPTPPSDRVAAALAARARQRGCVLLSVTDRWPSADLTLEVGDRQWYGLGQGYGRLRYADLTVNSRGRGAAGRQRDTVIRLPLSAGPAPTTSPIRHLRAV
ncbi:hypothetical protein [Catellatospora chokoriensis]|uniref:Uncharacterized protein n=1 Tax=Catellatospora chokoriensis TaxID=310353 RepID=A0A8J3JRJ3_9ACTN|nr:hypothetical protein [Catellatospora chokoriensis]GIF89777.1 hypothetical protein Cch02nite_32210 [Catellatospora chokoriensis]